MPNNGMHGLLGIWGSRGLPTDGSFNQNVKKKITASPIPINFNPPPIALGRPSKNLGGIFHSQLDRIDLHTGIVPTRTVPFTVLRTATHRVDEVLNNQTRLRATVMKIPVWIKGFTNGSR